MNTMTLVKTNPRQVNSVFDDFFFNFPMSWGKDTHQGNVWASVPVNIHETNEGFHVELSAPGRKKEDFVVNVENGLLTISHEEKEVEQNTDYKTIRREFSLKSFKRSFTLSDKLNADGIQGKYEEGILKLFIPKKEEIKIAPKQVTIL